MLIKHPSAIPESEVTPKDLYLNRRSFMAATGFAAAATILPFPAEASDQLAINRSQNSAPGETVNDKHDATNYNNFYEFSTDKEAVAPRSKNFPTDPWQIRVEGLVNKPMTLDMDTVMKLAPLEERIYRLRCVEAWSMVIPWVGFPLSALINKAEPLSTAKYIEFTTLYDPAKMPNQRSGVLPWPYVEGLRMDEAMHPLTLLTVGMYGEILPKPNGAPVRMVIPWKYGFKSIKSIVRIRFTDKQPATTWNLVAPYEYGFYANVNPEVDHPRWSQARERRIGEFRKRDTLPFNGYAQDVAHLYSGMDLRKFF